MAPFPVPAFITAIYNPCKDLFLYVKGQRRDIKDLEERISELITLLMSIKSQKEIIDRSLANSVSTEKTEVYEVMKAEIKVINKKYYKFLDKYSRITNNQLSRSTTELNASTGCLMLDQLNDVKSKIATLNFWKLAKLSRDIARLSNRASDALKKLKPESMIQKRSELDQEKLDDDGYVLAVFDAYVDEVLEYLRGKDKKVVGIFGPTGVGKTTVLKKLYNRMIEQKSLSGDENSSHILDKIISIECPLEEDAESIKKIVEMLQNEIMVQLNIDHEATTSKFTNANKISTFLCHKKYILLMDRVSRVIDLDTLGLRQNHKYKKVVIASSDKQVVTAMTEHQVQIQGLKEYDARRLFENICGILYDSRNREISERIIELCGGIPWMIDHVAKHLKDKPDEGSWNNAKRMLQSEYKNHNLIDLRDIDKVYEIMYKDLAIDTKKCLLYGALFPVQYEIYTDYLIECWIAEGFIFTDIDQKVRANREYGQTILTHLTDRDFLQWCCGKKYITMSPNFRRFALELDYPDEEKCEIWVPSKDRKPNERIWATVTRMSLIGCKVELPTTPQCSKIYTLLLRSSRPKQELDDNFFLHMESLQVLDLNQTEIQALPKSINKLVNLKSLYLNGCLRLDALPPEAAKLEKLEFLDISGTSIPTLPQEIRFMVNMRCLRASLCPKRVNHDSKGKQVQDLELIIPPKIISNLTNLEELSIDTNFDFHGGIAVAERIATELVSLEYLNTLCFNFPNVRSLDTFVNESKALKNIETSWKTQTLRSFKIFIGCHATRSHTYKSEFSGMLAERWLRYSTDEEFSPACQELLKQANAFEIIGHDGLQSLSRQFDLSSLKVCVVERCNQLEHIVDGHIASEKQGIVPGSLLQNMEKLYLYDLKSLQCIWDGPVPPKSFTKLTAITISGCPELTKILDPALARSLQSLEYLKVDSCGQVSKIIEGNGETSHEIEEIHEESDLLKSLTKIELSNLTDLQSICQNNTSVSWNSVKSVTVMSCGNLRNLCWTLTNTRKLESIQCEQSWWNELALLDELKQHLLPVCCFKGKIPIKVGEATTSGSSGITEDINLDNGSQSVEEETTLNDNLQASKMDVQTDSSSLEENDDIKFNGSQNTFDHEILTVTSQLAPAT